jgi:hypothetical protein
MTVYDGLRADRNRLGRQVDGYLSATSPHEVFRDEEYAMKANYDNCAGYGIAFTIYVGG